MSQKDKQKLDSLREFSPLERLLLKPGFFLAKHSTLIMVVICLLILVALAGVLFTAASP